MTIKLSKTDSLRVINLMREILKETVFHTVSPNVVSDINQHLDWMNNQTDRIMYIETTIATLPELELTRITLSTTFSETALKGGKIQ